MWARRKHSRLLKRKFKNWFVASIAIFYSLEIFNLIGVIPPASVSSNYTNCNKLFINSDDFKMWIFIRCKKSFSSNLLSANGRKLCRYWNKRLTMEVLKKQKPQSKIEVCLWEHTGSNRGPSACKADALNQLSYAPFLFPEGKDNM